VRNSLDLLCFPALDEGESNRGANNCCYWRSIRTLGFPLLVDKGREIADKYKAGGWIIRRTVYLIGKDGSIRYAQRGKPSPQEVLATAE